MRLFWFLLLASLLASCQAEVFRHPVVPTPIPLVSIAALGQIPQVVPAAKSLVDANGMAAVPGASSATVSVSRFDSMVPLPAAPADHLFGWPAIQAQIQYGLKSHLRNYTITEADWKRDLKAYQTKAIAVIAKKPYATPELIQALQSVPRPFLAYNYQTRLPRTQIAEDYGTIIDVGFGATMSAPSIQAFMTAQLHPTKDMVALEIGTGSGSQSLLLSYLVKKVYTIEVRQELGETVSRLIKGLGYDNIETKLGDGYYGWKEKGPFDIIIVTCQANHIPPALVEQLKPNGVMVIPVGPPWSENQQMFKVWKDPATGRVVSRRILAKTRFIPMLGANMEKK